MPIRLFVCSLLLLSFHQKMLAQWDTLDFQTPSTALSAAGRTDNRLLAGHRFGISYSDDFGENWFPAQTAPVLAHSIWTRQDKVYAANVRNGFDSTWVSDNQGQSFQFWGAVPSLIAASKVIRGDTMFAVVGGGSGISSETLFRWIRGSDTPTGMFTCPGFAYNLQILEWQNRLVLLSTDGIRWSDDAGLTWQMSASSIPISNLGVGYNSLLAHGNSLFYYNREGKVLRSDDDGETWNTLTFFQDQAHLITTMLSEGGQLLASSFGGPVGAVTNWRSGDNGLTWQAVYPEIFTEVIFKSYLTPGGKRLLTSRGCFAVSPDETQWETRQYGLPRDMTQSAVKTGPGKWVVVDLFRVYATQNHGRTFHLVTSTAGPWVGMQRIDSIVLVGRDDGPGFLRSDDGGISWTLDSTGALLLKSFYPFSGNIVLAQSYAGLYLYDLGTRQFQSFPGSIRDYQHVAVLNGVIFTEVPSEQGGIGIQASLDTAQTFLPIGAGLPANFQCNGLFVIGEHLFAKSPENGLYVSDNMGLSWAFSPGPPGELYFWPTLMAGAGDVAFASNGARVFITDDGGAQWFLSDVPVQSFSYVTVQYVQQFDDTLYLSFASGNRFYFLQRKISDVTFSTIKGRVFADSNNNQVMDDEETGVAHILVHTEDDNYALSNAQGYYTLLFESPGNVTPVLPNAYLTASPLSYFVDQQQDSLDFALYSEYQDVSLILENSGAARPGFSTTYFLSLENNSLDSAEVRVKTKLDPRLQFLNADAPVTLINDTLVWTVQTVVPLGTALLQFVARLDDTVAIGSLLRHTASVDMLNATDDFPENNADTLLQTVVGSFDPNDKTALRGDTIPLVEIQLEYRLEYRIRFQNTGNYPAEFVRILDTLETDFNPLTFRLDAASHPVKVRFVNPRILEFFFDHIQLPDSTSDEAGSHGFVRYSLAAHHNLAVGDSLTNSAAIYFDYNAPVITNTAVSVVEDLSGIDRAADPNTLDFTIAPNPAPGQSPVAVTLFGESAASQKTILTLYDAEGKKLGSQFFPLNHKQVYLHGLSPGIYFVKVSAGQSFGWKILIVQSF